MTTRFSGISVAGFKRGVAVNGISLNTEGRGKAIRKASGWDSNALTRVAEKKPNLVPKPIIVPLENSKIVAPAVVNPFAAGKEIAVGKLGITKISPNFRKWFRKQVVEPRDSCSTWRDDVSKGTDDALIIETLIRNKDKADLDLAVVAYYLFLFQLNKGASVQEDEEGTEIIAPFDKTGMVFFVYDASFVMRLVFVWFDYRGCEIRAYREGHPGEIGAGHKVVHG